MLNAKLAIRSSLIELQLAYSIISSWMTWRNFGDLSQVSGLISNFNAIATDRTHEEARYLWSMT
ncbi:hypothetical protein KR51_00022620 [Rubidibacter lacunae KORDI 51-2]|uniref:Uncharacterized protein n=1 Tax=Rubidibacter lacunae KORDI 51-2 TaxID=582515 RepID=U5D9D2_9CHRO|nr:hypothetical protein KR51_00022620 [Rubidibacter lacunae KORDI 51-2]